MSTSTALITVNVTSTLALTLKIKKYKNKSFLNTYFERMMVECFLDSKYRNTIRMVSVVKTKETTMAMIPWRMWAPWKHCTLLNILRTKMFWVVKVWEVVLPAWIRTVDAESPLALRVTTVVTQDTMLRSISSRGWNSTVDNSKQTYWSKVKGDVNENWWPWLLIEKEA